MKSFMFCFSGWQQGWTGPATTYTVTVRGDDKVHALFMLNRKYLVEKVRTVRELKGK